MGLIEDLNDKDNFVHSSKGKCTFCTLLETLPKEEVKAMNTILTYAYDFVIEPLFINKEEDEMILGKYHQARELVQKLDQLAGK